MNFNFESPYIEYDSDDIPYSFYEIHGIKKIRKLSRQLRTFLNYKAATIQYRFHPKVIPCYYRVEKKFNEIEVKFKQLALKFIKLLTQIKGSGISYEVELQRKLLVLAVDNVSKKHVTELKCLTEQLFTKIHLLSEQEIHLDPLFLKFIINLSQEACVVFKILNNWASGYYDELGLNYSQLHNELNELILSRQAQKSVIKKHQVLEEGLKEW